MHVSTESLFAGQPNKCCMIWCQVGDYDHESVAKVPAICPTVSLQKKHQAKNSLQSDWAAPVNWRCLGRNITIVPTLGMRWASWKWRYLAGELSSIAQKLPKLFAIEPDVLKITSKSAFRTSWMLWLFLDPDKKNNNRVCPGTDWPKTCRMELYVCRFGRIPLWDIPSKILMASIHFWCLEQDAIIDVQVTTSGLGWCFQCEVGNSWKVFKMLVIFLQVLSQNTLFNLSAGKRQYIKFPSFIQ